MKTEQPSVDQILDTFTSTLSTISNKHASLKKIPVKTHPWYNEYIKDVCLHHRVCELVGGGGIPDYSVPGWHYKETRTLGNKMIKRTTKTVL